MARKRKSKPTDSRRNLRQHVADRYAHYREDAQLLGLIETVPEEALRDERAHAPEAPLPALPGIVMDAVRQNWNTPPEEQARAVEDLLKMLHDEDLDPGRRIQAFNALRHADRDQWERDNPELAGKVKGGGVQVNQTQQVITGDQMIRALQEIEKATGQPIMSEAMLAIEQDASAVLPDEIR